ncbi:ATP-binding protein [Ochrobactrum sp. AN78]|uniref:ATP-binding protein n=1 Tax=Ochrobactrum sp. AN78 TaxID=3039853 RepID=UPI002989C19C|nr:ATP-binding protein [Ochrobactrum sp. AN78]MDH7790179.1 DNA helicase HerA-like ATPase [Ochrobactrum sp. AN78]
MIATNDYALIDPDKRVGTVTRVGAASVELTVPLGLAISGQRGLAKGTTGDFLFIDCDAAIVFGRLTEVIVPERQRSALERQLDQEIVTDPQGRAQLLATIDKTTKEVSRGINTQPRIGDSAYLAEGQALASAIQCALSGETKEGKGAERLIELGCLSGLNDAHIMIPPEKLFGRHCGIFGATGGGKSWTVSRLVNEVVRLKGKCILFDPTGEFEGKITGAKEYRFSKGDAEHPLVRFPYKHLSETDLYGLLTPSTQMQGPNLRSAIKNLRLAALLQRNPQRFSAKKQDNGNTIYLEENNHFIEIRESGTIRKIGRSRNVISKALINYSSELDSQFCDFDIHLLSAQVREECVKHSSQDANANGFYGKVDDAALGFCNSLNVRIENYLSSSEMKCIFSNEGEDVCEIIRKFIQDPKQNALLLSFEHVSFKYNTREILLNTIGRYLLNLSREEAFKECPLICFLDEAHQFVGRSIGDETNRVSLDAFGLIAKEGRKYGLTAAIATQRPRDVPTDVLSQLGTLFVHRLTNDRDRETIERACGDLDRDAAAFIPSLAQGEAIIVGPDLPAPLPVIITHPEKAQQPESKGPDYQKYWG